MNPDQDDKDRDAIIDLELRAHLNRAREPIEVPSFESVMAKAEAADAVAAPRLRFEWLRDLFEGWSAQGALGGRRCGCCRCCSGRSRSRCRRVRNGRRRKACSHCSVTSRCAQAADQQLLASLTSTTRWQAPSDRWLAVETDIDIFGLPDIGGTEDLKEESTWL